MSDVARCPVVVAVMYACDDLGMLNGVPPSCFLCD